MYSGDSGNLPIVGSFGENPAAALVAPALVDQVVGVEHLAAVIRYGIVIVAQVDRIDDDVVIGRCGGQVLGKGVIRAERDEARGLVPLNLHAVVIRVEVVLQLVDVLVERIGPEPVLLRRVEAANATAYAVDVAQRPGVVDAERLGVDGEQIVVRVLRIIVDRAAGLDAANDVDIRCAVIGAAVVGTQIDVVAGDVRNRQVRMPGQRLIDSAVVLVIDGAGGIVR